jgi:hypothetical protein
MSQRKSPLQPGLKSLRFAAVRVYHCISIEQPKATRWRRGGCYYPEGTSVVGPRQVSRQRYGRVCAGRAI